MQAIFQEHATAYWKGTDVINLQKAQLAVQTMPARFCANKTPSKFSSSGPSTSSASSSSSSKQSTSKQQTTSPPLQLTKTPNKFEPQNHQCEVLRIPGNTENNLIASRLQLYIESEFIYDKSKFLYYFINYYNAGVTH